MCARDKSIPLSLSMNPIAQNNQVTKSNKVDKRILFLSFQAILNTFVIGVIAKLLVYLIELITNLSFYGRFSFEPVSPAQNNLGIYVVAIPIIGSLLVGLIARFGSQAIRGHGIPEAMERILSGDSKIPPLITLLKPLSAAISIGTGGPFGAEGPIIATGGAFGSFTGQIMYISASERKIMLSAGACAGMAAIFGSPLAAVLLAIELLLFEFSARSIIPVTLACVTGAGMHLALFGNEPVFAMGALPTATGTDLIIYVLIGLVIGVIASLVSKSVYWVEDLFEKLPIHWMWWPAIGAVAVGVVGYYAPYTMGVGYDNIQNLLTGHLPLAMLLSLCFLKYLSWVIALGSGTSGGTLAPLFTIGGALGALIGMLLLNLFPGISITLASAALVGMAAMFAGASRALLTSIVFALETTGQTTGLLPLLCACIAAYFVSFFLMEGSIMTEKILRRGVAPPDSYHPDLLVHGQVSELIKPIVDEDQYPAISEQEGLDVCVQLMGKLKTDTLLVTDVNDDSIVKGKITAMDIVSYYYKKKETEEKYNGPARTKRWMIYTKQAMNFRK
ncbi:MAG TPA: chloride channel protein [Flavipsychrobacter sp.]|nr:chloride channel protein [Flavipsychrobacter sp.]